MKLANPEIEVHSVGVKSCHEFKIATNPKMFKMLSDSLYEDKILAPLRELSTNSWDAHIAAGCETRPFYVHLPNRSDPIFKIRDYGTGLSLKDLTNLYLTYGDSNRNESNDYTGMLGLGSKSAFAYGNSFVATSYYNGQKYVCVAGINEDGIPTLNIMDEGETDEENGLEVSFTVKPQDFDTFYNRALQLYKFFPVCPIVEGGPYNTFKIEQPQIILQGTGWRLGEGAGDNSLAIMGNVAYSIDKKFFSKYFEEGKHWYSRYTNQDNMEVDLLSLGLEIYFPIGDLDVAISREGLQYNKTTIDSIKSRLKVASDEIGVLINEHFNQCKTAWEARCLYKKLCGKLHSLSKIASIIKPVWNGTDITTDVHFNCNDNLQLQFAENCRVYAHKKAITTLIIAKDNVLFYINDIQRGVLAMAKRDSAGGKKIWIINLYGTDKERSDILDSFVQKIGIDKSQLIYASTVAKIQAATRNYGPNKIKQFRLSIHNRKWYWNEEEVDLNKGGYYVTLKNQKTEHNNHSYGVDSVKGIVQNAESLGVDFGDDKVIYGLRPTHVKKIQGDNRWINVFDHIKSHLDSLIKKYNISETLIEELRSMGNLAYIYVFTMSGKNIDKNKSFGKLLSHIDRVSKVKTAIGSGFQHLTNLASMVEYGLDKGDRAFDFEKESQKVIKTYPLLTIIDNYSAKSHINDIVEYVNFIDSKSSV